MREANSIKGNVTRFDLAVRARWAVPVEECEGPLRVISDAVVGIQQTKIAFVGTHEEFKQSGHSSHEWIDNTEGHQVIIPALVNGHCHLGMHLMKGKYDDLELHDFLSAIWPVEQYFLKDENVDRWCTLGTMLGCREMLLEGVTTANDMYFNPGAAHAAAAHMGVRLLSGNGLLNFEDGTFESRVEREEQDLFAGKSRVICLHSFYTSPPDCHARLRHWRTRFPDLRLHVHLHESKAERSMIASAYARVNGEVEKCERPVTVTAINLLDQLGCLDNRVIGAHMVDLTDEELTLCGQRKVNCAHCPRSNMKINTGLAKTRQMLDAGINVCLGTDSSVTNNGLSILDEATAACFVGKLSSDSVTAITAHDALRMATINGARAMGLEADLGSLKVGKLADLAVVDLDGDGFWHPHTDDIVSALIYTHRRRVTHTISEGRVIVRDGCIAGNDICKEEQIALMNDLDDQIVSNGSKKTFLLKDRNK